VIDVSIIIVNYNTCDLTLNAIRSVFASRTSYRFEIILVDNNSTDDSVRNIGSTFPQVKLMANQENLGFARANNQAMRIAVGRYILLLNSDTVIEEDTLQVMLDYMEDESNASVGASGCKVILPNGALDKACRRGFPTPSASFYYATGIAKRFPTNPKYNQYQLSHLDPDKEYSVDCLVGAFMVVRREVIEQVGLLDEAYFMYGEDIDWCYRIKQAGWDIKYYPKTKIIHHKGASSSDKPIRILYEFHRAMLLFYKKHYLKRYSKVTTFLVFMGISANFILSLLTRRFMQV